MVEDEPRRLLLILHSAQLHSYHIHTRSNQGTERDFPCRDPHRTSCVCLVLELRLLPGCFFHLTVNIPSSFCTWLSSRSPHEILSVIRNLMLQASVSSRQVPGLAEKC